MRQLGLVFSRGHAFRLQVGAVRLGLLRHPSGKIGNVFFSYPDNRLPRRIGHTERAIGGIAHGFHVDRIVLRKYQFLAAYSTNDCGP